MQLKSLLSFISICISSFCFANNISYDTLLLAGHYWPNEDQNPLLKPLLAIGKNQGIDWTYTDIKLPVENYYSATLYSGSCNQDFCVTAGAYDITMGGEKIPLFLSSKNQGESWTNVSIQPEEYKDYIDYAGIPTACTEKRCMIVASYFDKIDTQLPLLLTSKNGSSWDYPLPKTPDGFVSSGFFKRIHCKQNLCIAAGKYNTTLGEKPLIARSQDGGETWAYVNSIKAPFEGRYSLKSITCNEQTCMIGGFYISPENQYKPLLLISEDKGSSWKYDQKIFDGLKKASGIESVNCNENICVAVGYQNNCSKPLLIITNDQGKNWEFLSPKLPDYAEDYENVLTSVSCNSKICIAAGWGLKFGFGYVPLLAVSFNKGVNWSYQENLPVESLINLKLFKTWCSETSCLLVGGNSESKKPIVFVSLDNATQWAFPSSILNLPKDYNQGGFFDTNAIARYETRA